MKAVEIDYYNRAPDDECVKLWDFVHSRWYWIGLDEYEETYGINEDNEEE
jgi:hypothetical protein